MSSHKFFEHCIPESSFDFWLIRDDRLNFAQNVFEGKYCDEHRLKKKHLYRKLEFVQLVLTSITNCILLAK